MQIFRKIIVSGIALCALASHANAAPAVTLGLEDNGVKVSAGNLGTFTINNPTLKNKGGQVVPLITRTAKNAQSANFKFYDDTTITMTVDDGAKTITLDFPQHSPTAKSIQLDATVPFSLREGGKATFDGQTRDFPLELAPGPEGHAIWRGESARFEMTTALKQILAIVVPKNWQQLQDNRFWNNNQSFFWLYQFDMERDPANTRFVVKFEDVAGGAPPPELPTQIVDKFGQTALKDFPDKVKTEDELKQDIARDAAYYAALKMPNRDIYGGLPGSREKYRLNKTGFFHIEKIQDAKRGALPVMVDPDGNLFFQLGLCSLGSAGDSYTYVEGPNRQKLFQWLPPAQGEFASAYRDGTTSFSFYAANYVRKYGQPWSEDAFMARTVERLRKFGFNSEGAFSGRAKSAQALSFPTVSFLPFDGLESIPDTKGVFDPFTDGAAQKLDALFAERVAPSNTDPLLIGHFLGNEQNFENIPKVVPGLDGKSPSKRRLVQFLREKYGDVAKFNAAWEMKDAAPNFEALNDTKLFVVSKAGGEDMTAFFSLLMDSYYKLISQSYRKHCPNHLLLGNRWLTSTANNDQIVQSAGKYLDVVSVNYYSYAVESDFLTRIHKLSGGRPLLLSEWHFGSTEAGLSGGVRQVKDQRERGLAYRNYVEQAASLGFVVGHEWFSYIDQALTGRWFEYDHGEKGNIGLVNVADRPYRAMLDEATKANADVYKVLLGEQAPFAYEEPRFSGAKGKGKKTVLVPHALPGMTINGVMDNWPGLPAERITAANLVMGTDPGGVSADFRLAWDDANLYLFIQVKDPTPMVNEQKGDSLWAEDSIEMFISAENLNQGGGLQFADRQVLLSARKGDDGYRWYFNNAPAQANVKMEIVKNVAGDGYTMEAAIPFAGLGFKPRENQELLFDIGINDTTAGRRQFMWNGVARNSGDRGAWGRATLVK